MSLEQTMKELDSMLTIIAIEGGCSSYCQIYESDFGPEGTYAEYVDNFCNYETIRKRIKETLNPEDKLTPYLVFFNDGTELNFKAADIIAAEDYAEYRARMKNTTIDFIL